jgi:hypothetical protein
LLFRWIQFGAALLLAQALMAGQHSGVVSSGGQVVPGATVTASQGDRRLVTTTDEAGRYEFKDLAPGVWVFDVAMFGFRPARRELSIVSEPSTAEWNLELKPYTPATPPAPSAKPQSSFPTVDLSANAEEEVLGALAAARPPAAEGPVEAPHEANEAFLVSGSLSQGLQAAHEEDVFAQRRAELVERVREAVTGGAGSPRPPVFGESAGGRGAGGGLGGMMGGGGFGGRGGGGFGPGRAPVRNSKAATARKGVTSFGNRRQRGQEPIRGALSFNLRNSALDARPYSLTGQTVEKPSYAQSRFSLVAGGLLRIPKLIESSRTFFFVNYSGSRSRNPFHAVATLASLAERGGDFSQSVVRGPVTVYDPSNSLPFPDNRLPASRIRPAAAGLLDLIPLPNQPGPVQNYQFLTSTPQNSDNLGLRLNQPLSRRNRLASSVNMQKRSGLAAQLYGFRDETRGNGYNADLGWTLNLRARLINNLRVSFNRNRSETVPYFAFKRDLAAELGIQGTSHEPINFGPPNLSFTNFGGLSDASAALRRDQTVTLHEGMTLMKGRHNVSFGGEFRRTQLNSRTDQNARGSFSFSGLATSGFDSQNQPLAFTGFDFADFLLGLPQSSSLRFGSASTYFRSSSYNVFALDNWRIWGNLTINAGLRYEFFPPLKEKYGHIANLDVAPDFTGVAVVTPGGSGPYSGRFPDGLINPDKNNVSPRIGIAWRPGSKRRLQVRAGYGAFHDGSIYNRFATRLASQPPFASTASLSTSLAQPLTLENGFPASPSGKVTNTFAVDRGYRVGYAQTWNLAVQQELPHALVVELGYLGTKGTKLDIQRSPNRAAPGSPLTAEERRKIGNAVGFTFDSSEGNSIYHAGQVRLTRRFRRGLSANALYTFSKSIDNASSIGGAGSTVAQNDKDLRAERGLSSFDQRHVLSLFYTLTSPFDQPGAGLRGRGWTARLLRNWTLSGGMTARSGGPLTARVLGNRADSGGTGVVGSGRADATGAPTDQGGRFFNLAAFAIPPAGRFGNAGRNTIPGPGSISLNASFGRAFRLGEGRRWLEVRAESSNVTNHVNYSGLGTVINALNYGLPTAAAPMRTLTGTLRYRF